MTPGDGMVYAFGIIAAALFAWLWRIANWLSHLPEKYVPRAQVDARLDAIKDTAQRELRESEHRTREAYREIKDQLTRIDGKIDAISRMGMQ